MHIALATCAEYPQLTKDDQMVIAPLKQQGITSSVCTWNDPKIEWGTFDAVVVRNTWDYFHCIENFKRWLTHLEQEQCMVLNPVSVQRSNLNKTYLRAIASDGFATLPTTWIDQFQDLMPALELLRQQGHQEVILKPSISGGAHLTFRDQASDLAVIATHAQKIVDSGCTLMLQPFMPVFATAGEYSLIYFSGQFSHAVIKTPKTGDFRVQFNHGGSHKNVTAPQELRDFANKIVRRYASDTLFARVDLVLQKKQPLLVELELIEPFLFFETTPKSEIRFAEAVKERLQS